MKLASTKILVALSVRGWHANVEFECHFKSGIVRTINNKHVESWHPSAINFDYFDFEVV